MKRTLALGLLLMFALLSDQCNQKPVECDEQCRKEQRRAEMPKDGDAVMAEGAAQPGTLRLPLNASPEIVYPDGTKQDAGAVRIVKLPPAGGKR